MMTDHINTEAARIQTLPWQSVCDESNVSRINTDSMRFSDFVSRLPSCSGNCEQGRRACETPQACHLPEPDVERTPFDGTGLLLVLAVSAVVSIVALLHLAALVGWLS